MSDAAVAVGAPIVLTHRGKEYALSPLDIDSFALFERWLENRAFEMIEVRKGQISDDDYERLLSVWVEQCTAGRYRWGSKVAQRAARTKEGQAYILFLQLAPKNQSMSPKLAMQILEDGLAEVRAKMEVVNAGPFEESIPAPATAKTTDSLSAK